MTITQCILLLPAVVATCTGLFALAVLRGMFIPTRGKKIGPYASPRKALLVLDVQESGRGRSNHPAAPVTRGDVMIATINRLIDHCAAKGMEVAYIRQVFGNNFIVRLHGGRIMPGELGPRLDSRLKVINGHDFPKNRTDAFANRDLERFLIERQVNELYLVGVDAAFCVYYTARGALNRGYRVTVVKDAVLTSRNMGEVLERYENKGIAVMTSDEITIPPTRSGSRPHPGI